MGRDNPTPDAVGAAPGTIMFNDTEINGGLIRTGTIHILSHEAGVGTDGDVTTGSRMIIDSESIKIYDGVLTAPRVVIGNLA